MATDAVKPKPKPKPKLFDILTAGTIGTEGLIPGQTPLRDENLGKGGRKTSKYKDTIQGFPIDWKAWEAAPPDRKNFYYVAPVHVPKVIRKQWKNYVTNPKGYGLSQESTLEDAVRLFDQQAPQNKLEYFKKLGIDVKDQIKNLGSKFDLSQLNPLAVNDAYAEGVGDMASSNTQQPALDQTNSLLQAILHSVSQGQSVGNNPPITLDPITVNTGRNQQAAQMPRAIPQQPMPQQPMPQQLMPQQLMPQQRPQPNLDANGQTGFGRFLSQMGIPLATAIAGVAGGGNTNFLSGATGFQQGYVGEKQRQKVNKEEETKELRKESVRAKELALDRNDKKWNESYDMAVQLSKTGPFGQIEALTPEQVDDLAKRIYSIRYGDATKGAEQKTKDIQSGSKGMVKPTQVDQKDWDSLSDNGKMILINKFSK